MVPLQWQAVTLAVPDDYYIIMGGGRGGGKSACLVMLLLRDVIRFGKSYVGALVRRDLAGLQNLIALISQEMALYPELKGSRFLTGRNEFRFNNGAVLYAHYIKDQDSYNRFQGESLSHLYADELAQIPEPAPLLRLISSLRTSDPSVKPRFVGTCNSIGPGSWWLYQHIVSKAIPWKPMQSELFGREVCLISSTLFDNTYLTDREGYINTLKASTNFDPVKAEAEIYGRWGGGVGSFFGHVYSPERQMLSQLPTGLPIEDPSFRASRDVFIALDWGTRAPSAAALIYRTPTACEWDGRMLGAKSLVLVDTIYTNTATPDGTPQWNTGDRTLTTTKMAGMIRELCLKNGVSLDDIPIKHRIMDAALGAQLGSREGSLGQQLADAGCKMIAGPKGLRSIGWTALIALMEASGDHSVPGWYVTENCKPWFATVPTLVYDEKNKEDLATDGPDHLVDCIRYLIMSLADTRYKSVSGVTNFQLYGTPEPHTPDPLLFSEDAIRRRLSL